MLKSSTSGCSEHVATLDRLKKLKQY